MTHTAPFVADVGRNREQFRPLSDEKLVAGADPGKRAAPRVVDNRGLWTARVADSGQDMALAVLPESDDPPELDAVLDSEDPVELSVLAVAPLSEPEPLVDSVLFVLVSALSEEPDVFDDCVSARESVR